MLHRVQVSVAGVRITVHADRYAYRRCYIDPHTIPPEATSDDRTVTALVVQGREEAVQGAIVGSPHPG